VPVYGIAPSSFAEGAGAGGAGAVGAVTGAVGAPALSAVPVETAFVLSGGGNRGACQVGMLRALCERGIAPDLVVGSSIGAINAAFFAGQPTLEGTYVMAEMWRTVATHDVFPKGRLHGSWRFVERREAVYPIGGLRRLVRGYLRFDRLEDALVPLTVVVTRLDDGAEVWLTEGPALEAVLASAALPAIFPSVELEGKRYIDGGVVDNTPLSVALAAGARRIYVLLSGGIQARSYDVVRPYEALLVAFGLSIRTRLRRDLAATPADVDVIVLEQSGVEELSWQDFSRTEELLERSYLDARVVLDRVEEQLAERAGVRTGARWWSRTDGRPPLTRRRPRSERLL
jgi:NTE family protein